MLEKVEQKLIQVSEKFRDEAKKLNSQLQLNEVQKLESIQAEKAGESSDDNKVSDTTCKILIYIYTTCKNYY